MHARTHGDNRFLCYALALRLMQGLAGAFFVWTRAIETINLTYRGATRMTGLSAVFGHLFLTAFSNAVYVWYRHKTLFVLSFARTLLLGLHRACSAAGRQVHSSTPQPEPPRLHLALTKAAPVQYAIFRLVEARGGRSVGCSRLAAWCIPCVRVCMG